MTMLFPNNQPSLLRAAGRKQALLLLLMMFVTAACFAQSATISVDGQASLGTLFRSEAYNNVSGVNTGAATRNADYAYMNSQGLHARVLRVWVSDGLYDGATDTYKYSDYYSYLNSVSDLLADEILMCIPGNTLIDVRKYTPDQFKPVIKNIIRHFKERYPKIKYIEALNEPDLYGNATLTPASAYPYYKVFYEAVNEVNAELAPAVPLQVGGLAISSIKYAGPQWLKPFLDSYRDDPSPDKKLDFISYHTYSYKAAPKEAGSIRATIEGYLSTRGLPTTIPSFITETGLFPGTATSGSEEDDALRQAAGMASYVYWEIGSPYNIPFHWVMRHAAEVRKDQMVTRPLAYSDRLTPYGNSMKMFSMMKTERLAASSNVMDANGLGVYGLAASDATGVSVLVWNYQHTGLQDYHTTVNISNLPAVFAGSGIRKKVYRIDQTTSNNYYNVSNCQLQLVADTVLSNSGTSLSFSLGILKENNLQLVILEPAPLPSTNLFGLSVSRQANQFLLNWTTVSETNSTYFEVLRSSDGTTFTKLADVAAASNSTTAQAYNFTDAAPLEGINYYQVKLVGADNSRTASGVVTGFFSLQGDDGSNVYYSFGPTGAETGLPTSGVPPGWTASAVSRHNAANSGPVFTSTSPSNTYSGFSAAGNATMGALQGSLTGRTVTYGTNPAITTTIPATTLSALSYYEVTLTPAPGQAVKITNIRLGSRSIGSSGGPASVVIRTSIDNYASNVFAQDVNTNSGWVPYNMSFATPLTGAVGTPVTVRFYANDAVGATTTSTNNWRIDDLSFSVLFPPPTAPLHTFTVAETPTRGALLSWQTSSEQNVARFEVLRSIDGVLFTSIGQVAANGNSSTNSHYSFLDPATFTGINYYQVKEVFADASLHLSDIQALYVAQGSITSVYYGFGITGAESGNVTAGVPAGWTASPVIIGNSPRTTDFFTNVSNTGTYAGASQEGNAVLIARAGSLLGRTVTYGSTTTVLPTGSLSDLSFFEVSLTPAPGQAVSINRISFGSRSIGSSGGPASVVIRTSIDNYASNVFAQDVNTNSTWELLMASFEPALTGGMGQSVTLRIYANDAVGSTSTNNWRIDDLNIYTTPQSHVALPLMLTRFAGAVHGDEVRLQWTTEAERNTSHFAVERSGNGVQFERIGAVPSRNTTTSNAYAYTDRNPLSGISFYRLKQVDVDGNHRLYGPVSIRYKGAAVVRSVYASATGVQVHLVAQKGGAVHVALYDMNGRCLSAKQINMTTGTNSIHLPVDLTSGAYLVQVLGEGIDVVKQFIR